MFACFVIKSIVDIYSHVVIVVISKVAKRISQTFAMNPITLLLPNIGDCSFMTGEEYVIDILDTVR